MGTVPASVSAPFFLSSKPLLSLAKLFYCTRDKNAIKIVTQPHKKCRLKKRIEEEARNVTNFAM